MQRKMFIDQHTKTTFQALVDALIPATPGLETATGGVDSQIDEYLIWTLDRYIDIAEIKKYGPLSKVTAEMLDVAAAQVIATGTVKDIQDTKVASNGNIFASLSPMDRLWVLFYLEESGARLANLPAPFKSNPGLVMSIVAALNRIPAFGFYSEWTGYASTRLASPEEREQVDKPVGWVQAGYAGPMEMGRDFRGYLVETFSV